MAKYAKIVDRDASRRTVILKRVRLSFADSLKEASVPKRSEPGTRATHSANVLIEKDQPGFQEKLDAITACLTAASKEFKKPEDWWKRLMENSPKQIGLRKGTLFAHDDTGEIYKGYENAMVVIGKGPGGGTRRPKIMDRHKREVATDDINDVLYNGSYADVTVSFYATDKGGTARLTCSFEVIRGHQEGERMGGGGVGYSDDDFDDLEDDDDGMDSPSTAPAPAAAAPAANDLFV